MRFACDGSRRRHGAALDGFGIRGELLDEKIEEKTQRFVVELAIRGQSLVRETRPRDFALLRQERVAERDGASGPLSDCGRGSAGPTGGGTEEALEPKKRWAGRFGRAHTGLQCRALIRNREPFRQSLRG